MTIISGRKCTWFKLQQFQYKYIFDASKLKNEKNYIKCKPENKMNAMLYFFFHFIEHINWQICKTHQGDHLKQTIFWATHYCILVRWTVPMETNTHLNFSSTNNSLTSQQTWQPIWDLNFTECRFLLQVLGFIQAFLDNVNPCYFQASTHQP